MESVITVSKENFPGSKLLSGTLMVAGTTVGGGLLDKGRKDHANENI